MIKISGVYMYQMECTSLKSYIVKLFRLFELRIKSNGQLDQNIKREVIKDFSSIFKAIEQYEGKPRQDFADPMEELTYISLSLPENVRDTLSELLNNLKLLNIDGYTLTIELMPRVNIDDYHTNISKIIFKDIVEIKYVEGV